MTAFADLIAKLEAAAVGSRELDLSIWEWDRDAHVRTGREWLDLCALRGGTVPSWTTSLDAALSLVPEGKDWDVTWLATEITIRQPEPRAEAFVYPKPFMTCPDEERCYAEASTPALAICIAALKARAT